MRIEIDGIEIDVDREGSTVAVSLTAVRNGNRRPIACWFLNEDEDSLAARVSALELSGSGSGAGAEATEPRQ